ncbi:hypothetical protein [Acinetobacter haemolyticus]|uniref:hypothetical protein n=1 Tax=Acinetobacter haemolyticus TaxID=29430 RepID=UPI001372A948|nr:hypothetical protein [Acinetobacter haemolyticus]NAR89480.1 hypothetical protein [Acinetobacter haemolyticus]NAR95636.1 hypothetical protein [Acinetobacter haemolyticus]NAS08404.1 hypothetical protein [Acinetobacter haemolyticus]
MTLIECFKCGNEISREVLKCPHCGLPQYGTFSNQKVSELKLSSSINNTDQKYPYSKNGEENVNTSLMKSNFFNDNKYEIGICTVVFIILLLTVPKIFNQNSKIAEVPTLDASYYSNENTTTDMQEVIKQSEISSDDESREINEDSDNIFDKNNMVVDDRIANYASPQEALRDCLKHPSSFEDKSRVQSPCEEGTDCSYAWEYEQRCGFILDTYYPNCFFDVSTTVQVSCLTSGERVFRDINYWDPNLKFKEKATLMGLNN